MSLTLRCLSLIALLGGCGFGAGRIVAAGPGHTVSGGGGGRTPIAGDCKNTFRGTCVSWYTRSEAPLTAPAPGPSSNLDTRRNTSEMGLGVVFGMDVGYGSAKVGDVEASGYTAHYYLELVVPRGRYGFAVQTGYTTQHLDEVEQDATYSGMDIVAKLLVALGNSTVYFGVGYISTLLAAAVVDASGTRLVGGIMLSMPTRTFTFVPRVELQHTSAGDVDYSANAAVGSVSVLF